MTMGSSLKRLKTYYLNNYRAARKALTVIVIFAVILWLIVSKLFGYGPSPFSVVQTDSESLMNTVRTFPDTRPMRCRDHAYDFTRLESGVDVRVSIVAVFHGADEFDDLRLTLTSVVEYTPYDLYTEIVIIDDASDSSNVNRLAGIFLHDSRFNKAKMYRSNTHDGPSASRFKASALATGNVLVFVSSSSVVTRGWLQPLVAKLMDEHSLVAVPHYDDLSPTNRLIRINEDRPMLFTWTLATVQGQVAQDDDTITTPVMRGDVFAVRKEFLNTIGGFDEHLGQMRGMAYHTELSLRVWQCGGNIKIVTCSRVAVHVAQKTQRIVDERDFRHIVELAFDEPRKRLAYHQTGVDPDMTQIESDSLMIRRNYLRRQHESLNCRPFSWYLSNIIDDDVVLPSDNAQYFGKLRSSATNLCLGRETNEIVADVQLVPCHEYIYEKELLIEMNARGVIHRGGDCLEPMDEAVTFASCSRDSPDQSWRLRDGQLSPASSPQTCLTVVRRRSSSKVDKAETLHVARLESCNQKATQLWHFINF